jgi:3-oxoadipate enol-lactonase
VRRQAILLDFAGHGASDSPSEPTSVEDLARHALALLDHLDVARAWVCGLSLGGMVAQRMLIDFPRRMLGALVAGAGSTMRMRQVDAIIAGWIDIWRSEDGPVRRLDATWPNLVTPAYSVSPQGRAFYEAWRRVLASLSPDGLIAIASTLSRFDVTRQLASVRVPVLAVGGEHDQLAPPDQVRRIAELVPGGRYELIEAAAHLVNLERPEIFNRLLLELVAQNA